jgi:hypothetical protein
MRSSERNHAGGNYGGQVSIELLEPAYLLPNSICLTNSACLRDYPTKQRTPLLAMGAFFGGGRNDILAFSQLRARIGNSECVLKEESHSHPDIFVRSPRPACDPGKSINRLGVAPMAANLLARDQLSSLKKQKRYKRSRPA